MFCKGDCVGDEGWGRYVYMKWSFTLAVITTVWYYFYAVPLGDLNQVLMTCKMNRTLYPIIVLQ